MKLVSPDKLALLSSRKIKLMNQCAAIFMILSLLSLTNCSNSNEINGHSLKTALRSVKHIKERLPPNKRLEFEIAFGLIRDDIKDNDKFLSYVGGKSSLEIIEAAKILFQGQKKGINSSNKYDSWEAMLAQVSSERSNQDKSFHKDPRELTTPKNPNVLYKLHNF